MIYTSGTITIENQILRIGNSIINIANLGDASIVPYKRYPLFKGVKEWLQIFIIVVIVCNIWHNLIIFGDLYLFSIIILLAYNINEFRKNYYGLVVQAGGQSITLKTTDKDFLEKAQIAITDAINNTKLICIMNFEKCNIGINNGIINKGNRNKNEVKYVIK